MSARRTFIILCALPLLLAQCRCVAVCVGFFKDHSSKGATAPVDDENASRAMTMEQFVQAHANRGVPVDILRRRFDVADADDDGILTPEEIQRHRAVAAQNKSAGG